MMRRYAWLGAIVIGYLGLEQALLFVTETHGLLTPGGGLDLGVALLTLSVVILRLAAIFVVPLVLTVRVLDRLLPGRPAQ